MNKYYKTSEKIDLDDLDIPNNKNHTMSSNLDKYVHSKLPVDNLRVYLPLVKRLEIHGIYPDINIIKRLDLDFEIVEIIAKSNLKKDNSNSIRPIFLLAKRKSDFFLVCCVTPGKDLLQHYSSMLGYFLREYPGVSLLVLSYPAAEQTIATWSELDGRFVRQNDIVILGYSTFFKRSLEKDLAYSRVSNEANSFYASTRFLSPSGLIVNCLEANFGHWGNISRRLSQRICELGANEIIHVGKVGTLSDSSEIYKRIYIPSTFLIARRSEISYAAESISNSLKTQTVHLSSAHVSVTTTMEETLNQREMLARLNVETIDIESSKIAHEVLDYNKRTNKNVRFGAIYFSTDYLRKKHEFATNFRYDLSLERTALAKKKKDEILYRICKIITEYLDSYEYRRKPFHCSELFSITKRVFVPEHNKLAVINK